MSMEINGCQGLLGAVFGHKFEHVYDSKLEFQKMEAGIGKDLLCASGANPPLLINSADYVKSVCKRCGSTVTRNENKGENEEEFHIG